MKMVRRQSLFKKVVTAWLVLLLAGQGGYSLFAQNAPAWAQLTTPSINYAPPVLKGLYFNPDNPRDFEFIIDSGTKKQVTRKETLQLVNYFLAGLTLPADNLWVNLSPYEADRIIPPTTAATELGEGLLSQDYLLKQLSASLTYPESEPGKKYWSEINNVGANNHSPVHQNFNKVWIIPDQAAVEEENNVVMVSEASLKVMMEEDYLAMNSSLRGSEATKQSRSEIAAPHGNSARNDGVGAFRKYILPLIEKDVNQGKNFAQLRQIYHSLILATWFKKNFAARLYKNYADKEKITGIDFADKNAKGKIYNLYVDAFKKGAYNYVKREYVNPSTPFDGVYAEHSRSAQGRSLRVPAFKKITKRAYFSGGADFDELPAKLKVRPGRIMLALKVLGLLFAPVSLVGCGGSSGDNAGITGPGDTVTISATATTTGTGTGSATATPTATATGTETKTTPPTGTGTDTGTASTTSSGSGTVSGTGTATGTVTNSQTSTNTATNTGMAIGTGAGTSMGKGISYNPAGNDYRKLLDPADGGNGDARVIAKGGLTTIKIYLPEDPAVMAQIEQVMQKISTYNLGLQYVFVFSPAFGRVINDPTGTSDFDNRSSALWAYINNFVAHLGKYDSVKIQLGNEENFHIIGGMLSRGTGYDAWSIPFTLEQYYTYYNRVAGALRDALAAAGVQNKPIFLGLGADLYDPSGDYSLTKADTDADTLDTNLTLINTTMTNIQGVVLNLYCSTPEAYATRITYVRDKLKAELKLAIGEFGEPHSTSDSTVDPKQVYFDQDVMLGMDQAMADGTIYGAIVFAFYANVGGPSFSLQAYLDQLLGNFETTPSGYVPPVFTPPGSPGNSADPNNPAGWSDFWPAAGDPETNQAYFSAYLAHFNSFTSDQQGQNLYLAGAACYYLGSAQLYADDLTAFVDTFSKLKNQYASAQVETAAGSGIFWSPLDVLTNLTKAEWRFATGTRRTTLEKLLAPGNVGAQAKVKLATLHFDDSEKESGTIYAFKAEDNMKNNKNRLGTLRFTLDKQYRVTGMIDKLIGSLPDGAHKNILKKIASLPGQATRVYRYAQLFKDLLGFNLPREHAVVLHKKLLGLREALLALVLWHENGHILMDNGALEIAATLKGSVALPGRVLGKRSSRRSRQVPNGVKEKYILTVAGEDLELTDDKANDFAYMAVNETDRQKSNHYLLRALAREIFGKIDIELSEEIDKILGKSDTSGEGASTPTGGVNLSADWLKVKETNKNKNAKVSTQAFADDNLPGLRVVIKGLVPASAANLSRLIHQPAAGKINP